MGVRFSKRFLTNSTALMVLVFCYSQPARAINLQLDLTPNVFGPNAPGGGLTVLGFGPIAHVGGNDWDISAGQLILNVVPGPGATTVFASLTLTGVNGNPLVITWDPVGGNGNDNVTIAFSSAPGPGLAGFDPIVAPVFDSAALDGTIVGPGTLFPAGGPKLIASAFGAGQFGIIGPLGIAPGPFAGAIPPLLEPAPPVVNISGTLSFRFGGAITGEVPLVSAVQFPNSAEVQSESETPEPATVWLLVVGFAAVGYGAKRRVRAISPR